MAINVVSLFSGGGGLDLGFQKEGYSILWAVDNEPNAVATYKANLGSHILCADINGLSSADIPPAQVVIGGPPCQSFSLAGKRQTEDARGRLVWSYIHIIESVSPEAFVFENVTGLLSAKNAKGEKIIELLKAAFLSIGYTISMQVLNAADYGVPQRRKRVFIVGLKNGRAFQFPEPTHSEAEPKNGKKKLPYTSVEQALSDLPPAVPQCTDCAEYQIPPQNDYQKAMRSDSAKHVTEHVFPQMSALDQYIAAHVRPGGNYMDIPPEVNSSRIRRLQRDGGHTTCYGRLAPDQPAYTINTYFNRPNVGCNIHYSADRLITVREALRLQSFPDSYQLVCTSKKGKSLIVGNAVPPMLAQVIARQLKSYLENDPR